MGMNTRKFISFIVLTVLVVFSLVFAFVHPSVDIQFMIIKYYFCMYLGPKVILEKVGKMNM